MRTLSSLNVAKIDPAGRTWGKFTMFVWLTRHVNHSMSWTLGRFVTENRALVTWFTREPGYEFVEHLEA